jgi:hypothetical protein
MYDEKFCIGYSLLYFLLRVYSARVVCYFTKIITNVALIEKRATRNRLQVVGIARIAKTI